MSFRLMRVLILRASTLHQKKMNHEDAKSTKKSTKRKTFGNFFVSVFVPSCLGGSRQRATCAQTGARASAEKNARNAKNR
jgi:hypothetical protein